MVGRFFCDHHPQMQTYLQTNLLLASWEVLLPRSIFVSAESRDVWYKKLSQKGKWKKEKKEDGERNKNVIISTQLSNKISVIKMQKKNLNASHFLLRVFHFLFARFRLR